MNKILYTIIVSFLLSVNVLSAPKISVKTAILVDYDSDEILFESDPDLEIYPASMTKIMTTIIAFDLLQKQKNYFRRQIYCF